MGNEKFYSSILGLWVQKKPDQYQTLNGTYPISVGEYLKLLYDIRWHYLSDKQAEIEEAQRVLGISFEEEIGYKNFINLLTND